MVGKSQREDGAGSCFAYVLGLKSERGRRMRRFPAHEGITPEQPVVFLSYGGDAIRQQSDRRAKFAAKAEETLSRVFLHKGTQRDRPEQA